MAKSNVISYDGMAITRIARPWKVGSDVGASTCGGEGGEGLGSSGFLLFAVGVGTGVGLLDGSALGFEVGEAVGNTLGFHVGFKLGIDVGVEDGTKSDVLSLGRFTLSICKSLLASLCCARCSTGAYAGARIAKCSGRSLYGMIATVSPLSLSLSYSLVMVTAVVDHVELRG